MDMTSSSSSSTTTTSAPHDHQQAQVAQQASANGERKPRPQQTEALRCPRCDATNTKFCYYNNNSLTQPRYFCKACRRYWTQGGTLRNVPVGGGSRKNKRASGSGSGSVSSSSSATASASFLANTVTSSSKMSSINTQLMMVPNMMMPSSMTMGLFPNGLPTFMAAGSTGFDLAKDNQQVSLPFAPLSLSNQAMSLAPRGSGTRPSLMDMLRGGFLGGGDGNSYNGGLTMSGGINGMAMPSPLPSFSVMHGEIGGSTTDATQLMGPQQEVNSVASGLQWTSSQQQQDVVGDHEQKDNKVMDINNNIDARSSLYHYWTTANSSDDNMQG